MSRAQSAADRIQSILTSLDVAEREQAFKILERRFKSWVEAGFVLIPKAILDLMVKHAEWGYKEALPDTLKLAIDLSKRLPRYRGNVDRNAEIQRLHALGRSAGKIKQLIRSQFGDMSESAVRSVIGRARKSQAEQSESE